MSMKDPPHPGLSVRADCLEPLGLTVTEAAKALGVSRQALNNLIHGQAGYLPKWRFVSIRLSEAAPKLGCGCKQRTISPS